MKAKLLIAIITAAVAGTVQAQINVGANSITGTDSSVYAGKENTNAGVNSAIGGFRNNIIAGGSSAVIAGGLYNVAQGLGATISGGWDNLTTNNVSTIGGGFGNTITANLATIPGGGYAVANKLGQLAYSSGYLSVAGDSQSSLYVLRASTTSATPTELSLGSGSMYRMTLGSGAVWSYRILVTAKKASTGDARGWQFNGVIKNIGGATAIVGTPPTTDQDLGNDAGASGWSVAVSADNTNDALIITVTGVASTTISWVATVYTSELN
jgi:hypothetical protein